LINLKATHGGTTDLRVTQFRRRALSIVPHTGQKPMMPSLFTYFASVGAILLGLLVLVNSVLEPDGPRRSEEKAPPKVKVIIKHEPGTSLVGRLRAEEAAQKAAARGKAPASPVRDADTVAAVTQRADPVTPLAAQTQGEPAQVSAPVVATSATPSDDAAARAKRLARKKAKAERARKHRLARARALEQAAWRQQLYGYAPRPTHGPFDGWGQAPRW
jgi:hypothetical protein